MKKRTFISLPYIFGTLLTVSCLFHAAALPVFAEDSDDFEFLPRVYDEADLLTDDEEASLLEKLDSISGNYDFDVAVATVESTDGVAMNKFTDTFYDENYYGLGDDYDGILFMVSIGDRKWHITTHGSGKTIFTQNRLETLEDKVTPELKDGDFAGAFEVYADECDAVLAQEENYVGADTSYDYEDYDAGSYSSLPVEPLPLMWIPISIGIGFVLALICTLVMRSQLKSVHSQDSAANYVRDGSMNVMHSNDIYLYSTITQTAKPKDPDPSESGPSDNDHGGIGGSF